MVAAVELSVDEKLELSKLEERIYQGFRAFHEAGNALAEIRDRRLYRGLFPTFEAYCKEKWHLTRDYGYKLIEAAAVVENLYTNGLQILPENERQARAIAPLPPTEQVEAWNRAVEISGGKPTEAIARQAAAEVAGRKSIGGGGASGTKKPPETRHQPGESIEHAGQTLTVETSDDIVVTARGADGTQVTVLTAELLSLPDPAPQGAPPNPAKPAPIESLSLQLELALARIALLEDWMRRAVAFVPPDLEAEAKSLLE